MSDALDELAAELKAKKRAPLYLLIGDEFLVRKDADELTRLLVPEGVGGINSVVMDGASPRELASEVGTGSLFGGPKVVLSRDPEFLAPKKGRVDALGKARDAWKGGKRKEGARRLLALAARAGWGVDHLDPAAPGAPSAEQWKEELNVDLADQDLVFLREVAVFCKEEGVTAPESDSTALQTLLEKGLPPGHTLVIAATDVDAKHPLLKWAKSNGRVVERRVAAKLKDLDLSEIAADVLKPLGKKLGRGAEQALKDRLGGNMRLVQSELEKLAAYAEGSVIEEADVRLLVARVREEEFLELADALQKRDLKAALRYIEDALGQGSAPLLVLATITGQVRTLVENQERLRHVANGKAPPSFDDFKARLWPQLEAEAQAKGGRVPHPYAVFLGLSAAGKYGRNELRRGWKACAEADLALKSSADGRLVLERLVWRLSGA